jgi:putative transposase
MGTKFWRGGHTKHRLVYHLIWVPKYRKRVLRGKIAKRIRELIYQACIVNRWWTEEINVLPDHVHVLIQVQPTQSVSKVVKSLKGGTSKVLRKEFPETEEFLWGDSLWAEGYFAETVGKINLKQMKKYIKDNKESMPEGS